MSATLQKTALRQIAFTAIAATANSAVFALGRSAEGVYTAILNVTGATGTTETMDVVLASSIDKGTTYVNLPIRFTQITTSATNINLTFRRGFPPIAGQGNVATAATGGLLVKDTLFDPDYMRLTYTIGGTNPTYTGTVTFIWDPVSSGNLVG